MTEEELLRERLNESIEWLEMLLRFVDRADCLDYNDVRNQAWRDRLCVGVNKFIQEAIS